MAQTVEFIFSQGNVAYRVTVYIMYIELGRELGYNP